MGTEMQDLDRPHALSAETYIYTYMAIDRFYQPWSAS